MTVAQEPEPGAEATASVRVGPRRLTLTPGNTVVIGRDPECDLPVTNAQVSWRHLALTATGLGTVQATDLGSSNGSFRQQTRFTELELGQVSTLNLGAPDGLRVRVTPALAAASGAERDAASTQVIGSSEAPRTETVVMAPDAVITIGRDPANTLLLDDPLVSHRHAQAVRSGDGFDVTDLDSLNGIQLNGQPVQLAHLGPGDVLTIGHSSLQVQAGQLVRTVQRTASLVANEISFTLPEGRALLDRVSFAAAGASLVAVIGPSGAGKSTLLKALTGTQPATSGQVLYDGADLYANYANLRQRIGVVPQDDVVHRQLTVKQALDYAAELRLPGDYTAQARDGEVTRVMADLGLVNHQHTRIAKLSGGQRKRVSVALELLTQPNLLLLDEPTSGLDPNLDRSVMQLLRQQADGGRTVLVITHSVANLEMCDAVLILAPGGKVAYYGPPAGVLAHFGVRDYADVFAQVAEGPELVSQRFASSHLSQIPVLLPPTPQLSGGAAPSQRAGRQWNTCVRRHLRIVLADRSYAVATALLPLFLAAMALLIPGSTGFGKPPLKDPGEPSQLLVVTIVGAAFMGMSASIRELVGERAIFLRERAVGLSPRIYLWAKVCVLVGMTLVQSLLLVALVRVGKPGPTGAVLLGSGTAELVVAVFVTALTSAVVGLLLSALAGTSEQAMPALVIGVMFQLVMCGGLIQVSGRTGMEILSGIAPARWGFAMGASTIDLQALNPTVDHDWFFNHTSTSWLTSLGALAAIGLISIAATIRRLRKQSANI
ncbi:MULTISPECIES: ATP-binding cassette domain-containing protein [unclassified Luteococcus]|uniref:ATP-binding cassette domain-containing protein n=1 Tax=unclassified Luteococcus TaxID=2639923 RepID=UPI00313E5F28